MVLYQHQYDSDWRAESTGKLFFHEIFQRFKFDSEPEAGYDDDDKTGALRERTVLQHPHNCFRDTCVCYPTTK